MKTLEKCKAAGFKPNKELEILLTTWPKIKDMIKNMIMKYGREEKRGDFQHKRFNDFIEIAKAWWKNEV